MMLKEFTMSTHANSKFEMKGWDEKTWDGRDYKEVSGAKLTHAKMSYAYHGDLEAESTAQMLMTYRDNNAADYVGLEKIEGTLGGKQGSFVLQLTGGFDGTTARVNSVVVPGSGTGELKGLTGKGTAESGADPEKYRFELDYDFE
jgi:hypothetical protein